MDPIFAFIFNFYQLFCGNGNGSCFSIHSYAKTDSRLWGLLISLDLWPNLGLIIALTETDNIDKFLMEDQYK